MKNDQTKTNHSKSPKSATQRTNQDENKDPQKSAAGKKALVPAGGSRLPVLAKSLHLPTSSNFSLSNLKWEEKPLAVSASFSSRFEQFQLDKALILNTWVFSCRAKPRRKGRAPDLYLSAVHMPRLRGKLLKTSSPSPFCSQRLAFTVSSKTALSAAVLKHI